MNPGRLKMTSPQRRCNMELPCQHICEKPRGGPDHICACSNMICSNSPSQIGPKKCMKILMCGHFCQRNIINEPCVCFCYQCTTVEAGPNYAFSRLAQDESPVNKKKKKSKSGEAAAVTSAESDGRMESAPVQGAQFNPGLAFVLQQPRPSVIHYHSSANNTTVPVHLSMHQHYEQDLAGYVGRRNSDGQVDLVTAVEEYAEVNWDPLLGTPPPAGYQDDIQRVTEPGSNTTDDQLMEFALLRSLLLERKNLDSNQNRPGPSK